MSLTDTHCHIDFEQFDEDRAAAIARAFDAGMTRMLISGIEPARLPAAIALAEAHEQIYAAVGVHPNSGKSWQAGTLKQLRALAEHPKVVAIGEIGLDYYREWTPHALQNQVFRNQLALAAELELPIIIHNREATADVLPILREWQAQLTDDDSPLAERPGVMHSFSGNIEDAEAALDLNFYLGISGPVTFKNALALQAVAAEVPLDRLLIETDAPYLTPHPYRGQRNEPAYVRLVAEKIAALKGLSLDKVLQATAENAKKLFDW